MSSKSCNLVFGNTAFVSSGLIGGKDDIVVDDAENPSFFYGICDGSGGFKENISEDEKQFISKIYFQIKKYFS